MRCTVKDVKTVLTELRTGQRFAGTHHETFPMRREQAEAVDKTCDYYQSIWAENQNAAPRFLWNAKMRFGKTFTTYQLAKKLGAKRVLVLTFKPAVEDAWQTDLESHVDFDGWQYLSRSSGSDPTQIDHAKPVVYFGSFQDLLGRDAAGNIKPKNEWIHTVNWDLVVFDEYHFGAWRETAKELFEGEDEAVAKKGNQTRIRRWTGGHQRRPRRALGAGNRVPADHHSGPTSTCPAHPSKHSQPANSSKSRFSTGLIPTSSAPKKHLRPSIPISATLTPHCRKCACSPTRCPMNSW
jgi:hypothetical protein